MCIKQIKKLFCKHTNEQLLAAEELTEKQFNALNNIPKKQKDALELWELRNDAINIDIDKNMVESINSTTLTSEAVSFIDDKNDSTSRKVLLIAEKEGKYFVTEEGLKYIDYYINNVLPSK